MADPLESILDQMTRAAIALALKPSLDSLVAACPSVDAEIILNGLIDAAAAKLKEHRAKTPTPVPVPKTLN